MISAIIITFLVPQNKTTTLVGRLCTSRHWESSIKSIDCIHTLLLEKWWSILCIQYTYTHIHIDGAKNLNSDLNLGVPCKILWKLSNNLPLKLHRANHLACNALLLHLVYGKQDCLNGDSLLKPHLLLVLLH